MLAYSAFSLALVLPARPPACDAPSPHRVCDAPGRRSVLAGGAAAAVAALSPAALPLPALAADAEVYAPAAGSLDGTTILITGANTGLGLESAKRLAGGGAKVVIAARSKAKADAAVQAVGKNAVGVELDLADLKSVKTLPARLDAALGDGAAARGFSGPSV